MDEAELTASKVIPFPGGALAADGVSRLPDAVGGQGDEGPSPQGEMALPVRGELNLRLLAPLIRCLQEEHPPEALSRLADRAGVACVALQQDLGWLTHEQFEGILHEAREWLGSDEGFQRACAYQMKRRYFPMNLVFRAVSLRQAFQIMSRTMRLVSTISHFEVSPGPHPHAVALRYHSSKPESRLMCLSRQAQWRSAPTTFWKLPPAVVTESRCLAWGDDCCEYQVRWREPLRWRAPLAGLLAGGGLSAGLTASAGSAAGLALLGIGAIPLLGFAAGLLLSMRSSMRANQRFNDDNQQDIQVLVEEHLQARTELLALHHRQQRWLDLVEKQTAERTHALESVAARIEELREQDQNALMSFSHDMKNPMTIIRGAAALMAQQLERGATPQTALEQVDLVEEGIVKLDDLLGELMDFASSRASPSREHQLQVVETDKLVRRLRRQLKALVMGRDIRVSVFQTREVPEQFRCAAVVFDRILDNLLTNAAKYTERGSIVVELDGTPGKLCVKVSDTGRGIGSARLEGIFQGDAPDSSPLIGESHGVGLSIVVRMLDTIDGRLEVMSRPQVGTTFWLHLPLTTGASPARSSADQSLDQILQRVVTIRPPMSR